MSSVVAARPRFAEIYKCLEDVGVPPATALVHYVDLVLEWNEKVNITGAKTIEDFCIKHIADVWGAFKASGIPESGIIVDVGSGGGLPGIPLAIFSSNLQVYLVERRSKKAMVLQEIVKSLGLENRVEVICNSVELWKGCPKFAEFWFRGFLPGKKLGQFLSQGFPGADLKRLILMKGPAWTEHEKFELVTSEHVKDSWKRRIADAPEIEYILPKDSGKRILVIV